ncbi:MAG TPA: SDR family oxidoreductase [Steroidobacteraceae bacterium]|nr:SDR family oxidoreductase [Steroidobacteraceae bacterium]
MPEGALARKHHGPLYDMRGLGFAAGEVVVVTGAGSGIGKATALAAARSGLSVAVWDLCAEAGLATQLEVEGAGAKAVAVTVDVGDDLAVARAWDSTLQLGPCRYLVNNAGPSSNSTASFDDNLTISVGSVHRVTTGWIERCSTVAAAVVSISSIAGNFQGGGQSIQPFYPASKAAIAGYTRYLATRYRGAPRANAVAPGLIITPRTIPLLDRPVIAQTAARIPMGRLGFPEEIASAVLFLLSPAAAYVNGVLLPVDGAWAHA